MTADIPDPTDASRGAQVIERIQGAVGAGHRNPPFEVIEVAGVDVVVRQPGRCDPARFMR
jgi:hypothetical protein